MLFSNHTHISLLPVLPEFCFFRDPLNKMLEPCWRHFRKSIFYLSDLHHSSFQKKKKKKLQIMSLPLISFCCLSRHTHGLCPLTTVFLHFAFLNLACSASALLNISAQLQLSISIDLFCFRLQNMVVEGDLIPLLYISNGKWEEGGLQTAYSANNETIFRRCILMLRNRPYHESIAIT